MFLLNIHAMHRDMNLIKSSRPDLKKWGGQLSSKFISQRNWPDEKKLHRLRLLAHGARVAFTVQLSCYTLLPAAAAHRDAELPARGDRRSVGDFYFQKLFLSSVWSCKTYDISLSQREALAFFSIIILLLNWLLKWTSVSRGAKNKKIAEILNLI